MADITKCKGEGCPIKEQCYRFTAVDSYDMQSYFVEPPFKIIEQNDDYTKMSCDMYWGENQETIFNQLKDITNES
jgi:hypothetical protein